MTLNITTLIQPIKLLSGTHADTGKTGLGCFMNVIAYLNGEPQITDESPCVCVTVKPIAIWLNDYMNDEERAQLIPYIERAMGSATSDKTELTRRAWRAVKMAEEQRDIATAWAASAASAAWAASAESAASAARAAKAASAARAARAASAARAARAESAAWAASAERAARAAWAAWAESAARAAWAERGAWAARAARAASAERADYLKARKQIIDSALRYLDDVLPKAESCHFEPIVKKRAKELMALAR
jgi:hypothetical protein